MLYKDGRIDQVISTIETQLVPLVQNYPWAVSALPCSNNTIFAIGATIKIGGASTTSLGTSIALTTVVDVSGSGYFDFAAIQTSSATSSTLTLKLTVDGVELYNRTSAASTTANRAMIAHGDFSASADYLRGGPPIPFRTSLKVEAQQSANVSANVICRYRLAAP